MMDQTSTISDVKTFISTVYEVQEDAEGQAERSGNAISKFIDERTITLLEVIELLEEKLTSQATEERARAIDILYNIFNSLRPDFFSNEELKYIVEFLHDRLKDQHFVIPKVILCLEPIVRCVHLPAGSVSKLLNQFFREVNIQSHIHRHRRSFFLTLQYMLKYYLQELKAYCSNDFIMNFIQAMENEKDPRNLLIIFKCIPTILSHFPLGQLDEDFFEVLACYFPVDFNPTVKTPSMELITRENLASNLHICLSHTNIFSKYLIPLILEKLESSLIDAKLDSLNLFAMCCERSYLPTDIVPHVSAIWHALRREIFLGGNEKVEAAAISFIRSAFKVICLDSNALSSTVKLIFSECKHHLSEAELRMSQPTSKILITIAESNEKSCWEIFGITMEVLFEQFLDNPSRPNRKGILSIMKKFVSTLKAYPTLLISTLVGRKWDEILVTWFTLLSDRDNEFVILGLELFGQLFVNKISHMAENSFDNFTMSENDRALLQEHLFSIIMKNEISNELESSVLFTSVRFAVCFEEELKNILLNNLLCMVKNQNNASEVVNNVVLKCVSECSVIPAIGKLTLPFLLDLLVEQNTDKMINLKESKNTSQFISCLNDAVINVCNCEESLLNDEARKDLVDFLCLGTSSVMNIIIELAIYFANNLNKDCFELLTDVIGNLMRAAEMHTQQMMINYIWKKEVTMLDPGEVLSGMPILLSEALIAPLYPIISNEVSNNLVNFLLKKIASSTEAELGFGDISESDESNKNEIAGAIRLLAVLLNKAQGPEFDKLLDRIEQKISRDIGSVCYQDAATQEKVIKTPENDNEIGDSPTDGSGDHLCQKQLVTTSGKVSLVLLIWGIKSLAMKGFSNLDRWVDKLIEMLCTEQGKTAANGFNTILADCRISLTPKNHCSFRFLYKERIFSIAVPNLIQGYRNASKQAEQYKANYIKALSSQLRHIPKVTLHSQLANVVPLLVAGLNTQENKRPEEAVIISSLSALLDLFDTNVDSGESSQDYESSDKTIVQYIHDAVPRLVDLCQFKDKMEVRIMSLKCLYRCAKYPTHVILPLKDSVVKQLTKVLDDPKRLVRQQAVITRNIWILVGAPGGI